MSKQDGFTVLFDLTRRLFTDDEVTAAVEAELQTVSEAVSPLERALLVIARPLLAMTTPLLMFVSMCASFLAAAIWERGAIVFVLAAVTLPFIVAWPARALRRRVKRLLVGAVLKRARGRLTIDTRAIFASPAAHDAREAAVDAGHVPEREPVPAMPEPASVVSVEHHEHHERQRRR